MVGGTTRDYLLNLDVFDFDFVTDATPSEMKKFLPDANYTFEKYGNIEKRYFRRELNEKPDSNRRYY